jgi:hypothetical protein
MNFTFTWIMDKLGYMPKINMEVGKINFEPKFPFEEAPKKRPSVKKATTRKAPAKKAK